MAKTFPVAKLERPELLALVGLRDRDHDRPVIGGALAVGAVTVRLIEASHPPFDFLIHGFGTFRRWSLESFDNGTILPSCVLPFRSWSGAIRSCCAFHRLGHSF
jgi:hypothetical protein